MLTEKRINWLVVFSIFATAIVLFRTVFEFYLFYIPVLLLLPYFMTKLTVSKEYLLIIFTLGLANLVLVFIGTNTLEAFLKIYISIVLMYTFYYYAFAYNNFKTDKLFSLYLKFSYVIALIGAFQFFSYMIGFVPGYNFRWFLNKWTLVAGESSIRVNSIISEPSQLAFVLAPVIFISIYNLMNSQVMFFSKRRSVLFVGITLLTLSTHAYIIIIFSVLFIMIRRISFVNAITIVAILLFTMRFIYTNFDVVRVRVDDSMMILTDYDKVDNPYFLRGLNTSSFTLLNNYVVAIEAFKSSPIVGCGLGSHAVSFDKYSFTKRFFLPFEDFNRSDANSLLLRLLSETGLLGVSIFLFILIRFRYSSRLNMKRWVISHGVLVMMIAGLLREGHYFHSGVPFFLFLYIYNYKQAKQEELNL